MLSAADLEDVVKDDDSTEVKCEFCGEVFKLNADELADLRSDANGRNKKLH